MEESDPSWSVSDSVSTLVDGAEASDSGYAAGRSSGCEDEAYGDVSLASKAKNANDSHGPSSKRAKVPNDFRQKRIESGVENGPSA